MRLTLPIAALLLPLDAADAATLPSPLDPVKRGQLTMLAEG